MQFSKYFSEVQVPEGKVGIFWLGQAGFAFKTAGGKTIALDPYLTDFVFDDSGSEGYIRMTAPLFDPDEIEFDILLSSHEHGDHWDVPALPGLLKGKTVAYANAASINAAKAAPVDISKLNEVKIGDVVDCGEFKVEFLPCDHGKLAPTAMGMMLDFGFEKIYYSGDTCYNKERLAKAVSLRPDIALLPINGQYGNFNAKDAAYFANDLGAKICIPHHFWTFPEHTAPLGSPIDALTFFPVYAPDCKLQLLTPGKAFIV